MKTLAADGTLLEMNRAGLELIEADHSEQVIGRCLYPVVVPENRSAFQALTERVFAGQSGSLEFEVIGLKGGRRWLETHASPLRDESRTIVSLLSVTRDITQRKQAEAALHESDQRLRLAVSAANVGLWDWDLKTNKVYFSPEWKRQIGYAEHEINNDFSEWQSRVHPDDLEGELDIVRRYLANPWPNYVSEFRLRHKDGSYRWILVQGSLQFGDDGRPVRMLGSHVDLTERHQAEARLHESNQRFATIFRVTPVGKCITRFADGVFFDVNESFVTITGHTREELLGRSSLDLNFWLDPEDREKLLQALADNGFVRDWEVGFRRKDGSIGHSLRSLERLQLDGEDCILTAVTDITERKRMEQELQDSAASLAAAQERAKMGSWELDLATQTGCWSHGMFRLFGRDIALGPPSFPELLELVHPDDRQSMLDSQRQTLEDGQDGTGEFRFNRLHGAPRHFGYSIHCLRDERGQTVRLAGTLQDITERKKTEDDLAQSRDRLEVLSRQLISAQESERRQLARELHDEIGQALTGIKLNLKTLQLPALKLKSQTLVQDTINVVDQTLQQVRSLALDLRPPMLDDIGLVAALRWCLNRQSQRAGFTPHFVADSSVSGASSEINTAIFRVTQESLTNIARHANARNVHVEIRQHNDALKLLVTDDGIGFDVAAARDQANRGASIGLLGMAERVHIVGGQFEIESSPSGGTTINARFPIRKMTNDE